MRIVIGFLSLLLAAAPVFPWAAYSDIPSPTPVGVHCEGQAGVYAINDEWYTLTGESRDVFVHRTNGEVDFVYLTEGVAKGSITVKKVLTLEEARAQFSDPCAWILGGSA